MLWTTIAAERLHPRWCAPSEQQALEGFLHAWNAVKIDGQWLLVDTTWDDPSPTKDEYSTTYLFTPPRMFAYDHLPEEAAWQLTARPIGTGEFARQPLLSPYVGRLGVVLQEPTRSQVTTTDGEVDVKLANPFHATLALSMDPRAADQGSQGECRLTSGDDLVATFRCRVQPGKHEIILFGDTGVYATQLRSFGTILVNSRQQSLSRSAPSVRARSVGVD